MCIRDRDQPKPFGAYMKQVSAVMSQTAAELDFPLPFIILEPGRSVAAPAGITLYTVGAVKSIPGVREYVSVDGGMGDNPRYALYKAAYTVVAANRMREPNTRVMTISGRCCESGDLIQENVPLPDCEHGDILAVLGTGAYNYSMSSNYNQMCIRDRTRSGAPELWGLGADNAAAWVWAGCGMPRAASTLPASFAQSGKRIDP